ncbi:hypothetical protein ACYFX5_10040 [Bremerella sp. T1]|jgi:biopolymer transport protein ExbD|uniref:hypothetical protein n=1 Tax=Bremerella sp. TYQ1 TaxID=3119568 RepID=UPI001CCE4D0C|nr:hypothetical protein [Bremerella volcania]UBM38592.1 hypothetical protein LA756_11990 [Bremerella volcania]
MIAPRHFHLAGTSAADRLDVVLSPTGKTFVDGKIIILTELLAKLCGDSRCENTQVRIYAASACRFDHLADVYRLCKAHGIQNVELVA